jgi:hypothetical protein
MTMKRLVLIGNDTSMQTGRPVVDTMTGATVGAGCRGDGTVSSCAKGSSAP